MAEVVRLASSRERPIVRACGTCQHLKSGWIDQCRATGSHVSTERLYSNSACGVAGKLWEARVRLGLVGHIRRALFGD